MAYVSVPKDLTRVKNKVALNMTRRQLICFGTAGGIGIPFYLLARNTIGDSSAMMGMVVLMVPAFLFAMYEKDGMPLEKVLLNMVTVKYRRPQVRRYETENIYEKAKAPAADAGRKNGKKRKNPLPAGRTAAVYGSGNIGRNMEANKDAALRSRASGTGYRMDKAAERR